MVQEARRRRWRDGTGSVLARGKEGEKLVPAKSQISPVPSPFRNFRFRPMQGVAYSCMVTDMTAYSRSFLLACAFPIQQSFRA